MTAHEMADAYEKRLAIFESAGWICEVCGGPLKRHGTPQLGHRIPQDKPNLEKYGKKVIHHPLNMVATCCLKCNAAVSIRNNPVAIAALVERIKTEIEK